MPRLLVRNFSISLDGYAAGPTRISIIRSVLGAPSSMNGYSPHAAAVRWSGEKVELRDWTTTSSRSGHLRGCHHHGPEHVRRDSRTVGRQ